MDLPPQKPSRARYVVLAFLCGMAFILYLDRTCISQAVVEIKRDLGIDNEQMSFVLMAFTLAYGLFEVPTGRWGDRYGSRRVLTRIVIWWSLFTALTGACFWFWQLLLVRFLFGAGEAGAYPNTARIFARWFNVGERGRLNGIMLAFAQLGSTLAPAVAAWLIGVCGWRWTFVIFGGVGVFWAVWFYSWFRDDPAEHPAVNELERQTIGVSHYQPHIEPIPWRLIFANPNIWLLGGIMTMASFMSYFYFSWYPTYLREARDLSRQTSGNYASLVFGLGTIGTLGGGFLASALSRHPNRQALRRLQCSGLFALSAASLLVSLHCDDALQSAVFAGVSVACMASYQAHWWACVTELAGRHLGALFGLLNGMGVVGAMASQYFFGALGTYRAELGYTGREQWDPAFYVYAAVLALGAVSWLFVDTSRPLQAEAPEHIDSPLSN
jgi:MFS transporter, ACS family, glucarate transporter